MQVRIDKDVARLVREHAKRNGRSWSRETTMVLALYYAALKKQKERKP